MKRLSWSAVKLPEPRDYLYRPKFKLRHYPRGSMSQVAPVGALYFIVRIEMRGSTRQANVTAALVAVRPVPDSRSSFKLLPEAARAFSMLASRSRQVPPLPGRSGGRQRAALNEGAADTEQLKQLSG